MLFPFCLISYLFIFPPRLFPQFSSNLCISLSANLLAMNSILSFAWKNLLFHFHLWRAFSLNRDFQVDGYFLRSRVVIYSSSGLHCPWRNSNCWSYCCFSKASWPCPLVALRILKPGLRLGGACASSRICSFASVSVFLRPVFSPHPGCFHMSCVPLYTLSHVFYPFSFPELQSGHNSLGLPSSSLSLSPALKIYSAFNSTDWILISVIVFCCVWTDTEIFKVRSWCFHPPKRI